MKAQGGRRGRFLFFDLTFARLIGVRFVIRRPGAPHFSVSQRVEWKDAEP